MSELGDQVAKTAAELSELAPEVDDQGTRLLRLEGTVDALAEWAHGVDPPFQMPNN